MTAMDITTTTSGATVSGSTTEGIETTLHSVADLAVAKPMYTALLGFELQTDAPTADHPGRNLP